MSRDTAAAASTVTRKQRFGVGSPEGQSDGSAVPVPKGSAGPPAAAPPAPSAPTPPAPPAPPAPAPSAPAVTVRGGRTGAATRGVVCGVRTACDHLDRHQHEPSCVVCRYGDVSRKSRTRHRAGIFACIRNNAYIIGSARAGAARPKRAVRGEARGWLAATFRFGMGSDFDLLSVFG